MTKFLNTDRDTGLGGLTPSDEKVSSQKAIKTYIDTEDAKRVSKTSTASQVYATDGSGNQTTISYTTSDTASTIVQRDPNKQVNVAETPTNDKHAASKKYVDTEVSKKVTANAAITGATHTKITYDEKGLVTSGTDIVTSDVTDLTSTATEINQLHESNVTKADLVKLHGVTATATELNTLNGITSTTSELNQLHESGVVKADLVKLHAVTVTAPEINHLSGVTSNVQTQIDGKVDKTSTVKKIYATDANGNQTTISYSNTINAGYIVQRDANAQVIVPDTPIADENAASKKYVDEGLALKPDTTSLDDVAFSGSYNDLIDVPTYKTINSEVITGTGNILLQTQLSGTNGNVVIYTSTTGTLSELGFDNTPTQNSNKLVKSGPIWTELNKKVNITDIKNDLTSADTDKPLSAYQGKILDEKITLVQQSTHDRGVVLNALNSQGQNYTINTATINTAGTNYTVGDTLFLVSDMAIDAIINVTGVNSTTGAITSIALGQGGAFTTAPASTAVEFTGGTGTGAKFNLTSSQVNNSTLLSISNPQPNDFATVLHDEIHNDLRYVWKYADLDNDGTYEWVAGYPITNIERNFYNDPIKDGELATNTVTTVKIANNNVTAEKIADDAILGRHISTGAITDDSVASGANIQQSKIQNLTTDLANKVDKTSTAYQLYGTAGANTQITITYKTDNTASTIVQRDSNSQINVAQTPTQNTHATSKKYVNDEDAKKVDKVSTANRVYGTNSSGAQTTYDIDSFGKVDDVKVGDTSVVVNKIATLGTMALEDAGDFTQVLFVDWS